MSEESGIKKLLIDLKAIREHDTDMLSKAEDKEQITKHTSYLCYADALIEAIEKGAYN